MLVIVVVMGNVEGEEEIHPPASAVHEISGIHLGF
jgi:hypothetical protein